MTKLRSKTQNARQRTARHAGETSAPKTKPRKQIETPRKSSPKRPVQRQAKVSSCSNTKQAQILAMLCSPAGATIASLASATKWQPHSVRGFLAGTVRKKLKLNLISEPGESGRIYRILDVVAGSVSTSRAA